jgi:hypothetical protein
MVCEYINLKLTGSKGCVNEGSSEEMFWNQVRLVITKNGVSQVQNLTGGIEKIEEHLNKQLERYTQQGWKTVLVEKNEETKESRFLKNTIQCVLKRSVKLEPNSRLNQLITDSTRTYQLN